MTSSAAPAPGGNPVIYDTALSAAIEDKPLRVTRMVVTWGEEVHQPIQYNGFRVGSIELEIEVAPGEDPRRAYGRAWQLCEQLGARQAELKLQGFLKRLKQSAIAAREEADR